MDKNYLNIIRSSKPAQFGILLIVFLLLYNLVPHNEGNYFCTNDQLKEIEDNNQIAIYYCDQNGNTNDQINPNGSIKNIAGIFNKEKNVLGMMPHPERMIDESLSGEDGSIFFKNLLNNIK